MDDQSVSGHQQARRAAFRCESWRAAYLPDPAAERWSGRLTGVAELVVEACRDLVVATPHLGEDLCAAGGLIARMATAGADIEILAVTDGDGASAQTHDSATSTELSRTRRRQPAVYRRLGAAQVRRHRLQLPSGTVRNARADVIAAVSELIGHDTYPGVCVLAPWRHDGHPDHDTIGHAVEDVCQNYDTRLLRYIVAGWNWADSDSLPLDRLRRFNLTAPEQHANPKSSYRPEIRSCAPSSRRPRVLPHLS